MYQYSANETVYWRDIIWIQHIYIRIYILTYIFKVYKRYKSLWGGLTSNSSGGPSILNRLLKWGDGKNPCKGFWKKRNVLPLNLWAGLLQQYHFSPTNLQKPWKRSGNLTYYCKLSFRKTLSYVGPRFIVTSTEISRTPSMESQRSLSCLAAARYGWIARYGTKKRVT